MSSIIYMIQVNLATGLSKYWSSNNCPWNIWNLSQTYTIVKVVVNYRYMYMHMCSVHTVWITKIQWLLSPLAHFYSRYTCLHSCQYISVQDSSQSNDLFNELHLYHQLTQLGLLPHTNTCIHTYRRPISPWPAGTTGRLVKREAFSEWW